MRSPRRRFLSCRAGAIKAIAARRTNLDARKRRAEWFLRRFAGLLRRGLCRRGFGDNLLNRKGVNDLYIGFHRYLGFRAVPGGGFGVAGHIAWLTGDAESWLLAL